jgi:signal transduction histidine kinase
VLDLSKIEAGKLELNPQTVQLAPLINEVIGTAGQLAEQNKNRLKSRPRAYFANEINDIGLAASAIGLPIFTKLYQAISKAYRGCVFLLAT